MYGRFTALACVCSVFGVYLASLNTAIEPIQVSLNDAINRVALFNVTSQEQWTTEDFDAFLTENILMANLLERSFFYAAFQVIPEGLFLFCLNCAQLMVLERIARAAVSSVHGAPARWIIAKWMTVGIIVAFHLTSFCCRIALALFLDRLVRLYEQIVLELKQTQDADKFKFLLQQINGILIPMKKANAVHNVCDMAVLLFTVATFLLVGAFCARRIKRILQRPQMPANSANVISLNQKDEVRSILFQVIATCLFVFVSLASMAFFVTFQALNNVDAFGDDLLGFGGDECPADGPPVPPCDPCHSVFHLIGVWRAYTPEFNLGFLLPAPCALLVALWGMTSKRLLHAFKRSWQRQGNPNADAMVPMQAADAAPLIAATAVKVSAPCIASAADLQPMTVKLNDAVTTSARNGQIIRTQSRQI
jgi:hypothetical protein